MSKITETPAIVTDETAEASETETAVNSAIQKLMSDLETNFITKKSFLQRAAIISGVVGATALAIGFALGRSSSNDDSDEETETTED